MRYVYLNGDFILEEEAKISIFDSSIVVGDIVLEVARTFNHAFFKLDSHIERLLYGVKELNFNFSYEKEKIEKLTKDLFNRNSVSEDENVEWQIVYVVTNGLKTHFKLYSHDDKNFTFAILCFPLKFRLGCMKDKYLNGCKLLVANQRAIPNTLLPPQIKSRGRLHFKLAKLQVQQRDANADALLLDNNNCITEVSGSNLFLVKNNAVYTAPSDCVVSGITREYVIKICESLGLEVIEKKIPITEINQYDEAFITSTIIGIIYVRQIETCIFSDMRPGNITLKIIKKFIEDCKCDFASQAVKYAEDPDVAKII